jgi:LacI family transcriptional regulator
LAKRPTQADVAERAGVSRATVSYVLNDRTGGSIRITEETRQRVLQSAEELGYEPNALARSLRSGLTHVVGLLIPDVRNPHYFDILGGVEDEVVRQDYYLVVVSANLDPEREGHCLQSLFEQRLDGLILAPTFIDRLTADVEALLQRASSVVFLIEQEGANCVYADTRGGAKAMMDHLISLGHSRIAFVNGVVRPGMAQNRVTVYRERVASLGLPLDGQLLWNCGHTLQDGYCAAHELLSLADPPTAIWTTNDLLAIGALRAIRERGLRVPEDISLAGFDDIEFAAYLYPPLTTVDIHGEELGRQAAQMLFRHIEDPDRGMTQEMVHTELVVRQSTASPKSL